MCIECALCSLNSLGDILLGTSFVSPGYLYLLYLKINSFHYSTNKWCIFIWMNFFGPFYKLFLWKFSRLLDKIIKISPKFVFIHFTMHKIPYKVKSEIFSLLNFLFLLWNWDCDNCELLFISLTRLFAYPY